MSFKSYRESNAAFSLDHSIATKVTNLDGSCGLRNDKTFLEEIINNIDDEYHYKIIENNLV
jgi:hypothetical protein